MYLTTKKNIALLTSNYCNFIQILIKTSDGIPAQCHVIPPRWPHQTLPGPIF